MTWAAKDIPVRDVRIAANAARHGGPITYRGVMALTGCNIEKVVYAKLEKLASKGRMEWGVSVRSAWWNEEQTEEDVKLDLTEFEARTGIPLRRRR